MSAYATVQEAEEYFATRRAPATWIASEQKELLLQEATDAINNLSFIGRREVQDQINEFPRDWTALPVAVKNACIEEAATLSYLSPDSKFDEAGVLSRSMGPFSESRSILAISAHTKAGLTSRKAWNLLLPYMTNGKAIRIRRI